MPDRTIEPTPIPVSAAPQGSVFLTGEQDNRKTDVVTLGGHGAAARDNRAAAARRSRPGSVRWGGQDDAFSNPRVTGRRSIDLLSSARQ